MAFGKKNRVNLDPLSYSLFLLGSPKVGKTTIIKEMCEKLGGEDCYLFLELGQERGADAIEGINYVNVPDWRSEYDETRNSVGFIRVVDDIIANKDTEYPDLKVVIWDTYDQIIPIAEEEAITKWNQYCRNNGKNDKVTETINAAWGGYGKGSLKAIEYMLNAKARLKEVGVETWVIGHIKHKDVADIFTGESYQVLTSDQQQNYFNAWVKNVHFMATAYIDRTFITQKTNNKDKDGNYVTKNFVSTENRKIKLRDDNYTVDSGSRFKWVKSEIDFNVDEFINAIKEAIETERTKSGLSREESEKLQKEHDKKLRAEEQKAIEKHRKDVETTEELNNVISKIVDFIKDNKTNATVFKPILNKCRELGYSNPKEIDNIENARIILEMIS